MMRGLILSTWIVFTYAAFAEINSNLIPVQIQGLGLDSLPVEFRARLRVRLLLQNDERDTFPETAPENKFRVFATNETDALPLGSGSAEIIDTTGNACPWIGDASVTFWLEGRMHGASAKLVTEASLDGIVVGQDSIRVRSAPFLVLSNCDVADKLFYVNMANGAEEDDRWEVFVEGVTNAVQGFLEAEETSHGPFPQDVAEIGWSGPPLERVTVWSMERDGFAELRSTDVGVFKFPHLQQMGGNVEATPPTPRHPHGRIVVGSNLAEEAKAFLRAQEIQTEHGRLIELPLDWLRVGHVDEIMSAVPVSGGDGFKILVGDLDLAIALLSQELHELETWLGQHPDDEAAAAYHAILSDKLAPYTDSSNATDVDAFRTKMARTFSRLAEGLSLPESELVKIPVLYPIHSIPATGFWSPGAPLPNPINMVVLHRADGAKRYLIPDSFVESFNNHIEQVLTGLGMESGEGYFILSAGPHSWSGEVHCATNVKRRRLHAPPVH